MKKIIKTICKNGNSRVTLFFDGVNSLIIQNTDSHILCKNSFIKWDITPPLQMANLSRSTIAHFLFEESRKTSIENTVSRIHLSRKSSLFRDLQDRFKIKTIDSQSTYQPIRKFKPINSVRKISNEKIANRMCDVFEEKSLRTTTQYWVDQETKYIFRQQHFNPDYARQHLPPSVTGYEILEFETLRQIPKNLFEIPQGFVASMPSVYAHLVPTLPGVKRRLYSFKTDAEIEKANATAPRFIR